jgi:DNA-directed RNA polymerase specialized sigma24 family protein
MIGVPLGELRAAITLAHLAGGDDGLTWSAAEWERVWVRLSPRQQHVVYLHVLVGLNHTAIAEQLGLGRGAVDGLWRRALKRIHDALPHH